MEQRQFNRVSEHSVTTPSPKPDAGANGSVDVVIVGGGLAGSLAAIVLGRQGHRIALVDMHARFPASFRCEKLAGDQLALLRGLDLFHCLTAVGKPIYEMHVARFGRLVDHQKSEEWGFLYEDLVNSVRAHLPAAVDFVVGHVADIATGPERQTVTLSNGDTIEARLVVLASGYSDAVRQKVGVERKVIRDAHSLSLGFSLVPAEGNTFGFPGLTYYGDRLAERIAYVSIFPVGETMRANLFCYRGHDGAWGKAFRERPREMLFAAMPGLKRILGDIETVGSVKLRVADLYVVEGHRRDGVVLIGDASQTTCPAAGNGVTRVLTDVTQLCTVHVPGWLATPGMAADKINAFYDDPIKRACDEHCLWTAEYARSFATDPGSPGGPGASRRSCGRASAASSAASRWGAPDRRAQRGGGPRWPRSDSTRRIERTRLPVIALRFRRVAIRPQASTGSARQEPATSRSNSGTSATPKSRL